MFLTLLQRPRPHPPGTGTGSLTPQTWLWGPLQYTPVRLAIIPLWMPSTTANAARKGGYEQEVVPEFGEQLTHIQKTDGLSRLWEHKAGRACQHKKQRKACIGWVSRSGYTTSKSSHADDSVYGKLIRCNSFPDRGIRNKHGHVLIICRYTRIRCDNLSFTLLYHPFV
jgi:hypothetical protein